MAKAVVVSAGVAAAVTAAAFLLNPSPEQHRTRIKQAIGERSPLAAALGLGALTPAPAIAELPNLGPKSRAGLAAAAMALGSILGRRRP